MNITTFRSGFQPLLAGNSGATALDLHQLPNIVLAKTQFEYGKLKVLRVATACFRAFRASCPAA